MMSIGNIWPPRKYSNEETMKTIVENAGCDLPFVFGRRDEIADQNCEQIVINHRAVIITVEAATAFLEDGTPEKNRARQRNQPEKRAQKIIPAINKCVLQPDVKN